MHHVGGVNPRKRHSVGEFGKNKREGEKNAKKKNEEEETFGA